MPANLSPEYKAAEASFRKTRDPRERLEWLREMLRTIPKHKGTEHLQGDIKARIKDLASELEGARKGGGHSGPALMIRPEGAAQITLIGPPNAGKSALHARLTVSGAHVAPYPFTTHYPEPGMMPHEDVHFQLVDLPAVSPEHPVPWLASTLQTADADLLVVDLGEPSCLEQMQAVHATLREKRLTLTERWNPGGESSGAADEHDEDPFALRLPTLMLATKADRIANLDAELEAFRELMGLRYPMLAVSAITGHGLGEIGPWLFRHLGIVRSVRLKELVRESAFRQRSRDQAVDRHIVELQLRSRLTRQDQQLAGDVLASQILARIGLCVTHPASFENQRAEWRRAVEGIEQVTQRSREHAFYLRDDVAARDEIS